MKSNFCLNCSKKAHLCNKSCPKILADQERRHKIAEAKQIELITHPWKTSGARQKATSEFYRANHRNKTLDLY